VRVHEWEPANASEQELDGWLHILNEVFAHDIPDEPTWGNQLLREYLYLAAPGERRIHWLAYAQEPVGDAEPAGWHASGENADTVCGTASLLLPADSGTCVVDVLVPPRFQRRGIGRALLTTAAWRAHGEGRQTLSAEVVSGTAAVPFYEACGFERVVVEVRYLLRLDRVDWSRVRRAVAQVVSGYRIEYFQGGPPADLLPAYAEAKSMLRYLTAGEHTVDEATVAAEAKRLSASLDTLHRRGLRPHVVLAIHNPTGQVAGLTELVVPAQRPARGDEYDTLVLPRHRGYGLALAMKSRMLLGLQQTEPQLVDIQTWQNGEYEPQAQVNAELGYVRDREWYEYETTTSRLISRLGAVS